MRKPKTILFRLYPGILIIILLTITATTWHAGSALQRFYRHEIRDELLGIARLAAPAIAPQTAAHDTNAVAEFCKQAGASLGERKTRFTIIAPDGVVQGDSAHDPGTMANHADRPEIQQALRTGDFGWRIRRSPTLGIPMMYVAIPLKNNGRVVGVMRTSRPISRIAAAIRTINLSLLIGGVLAAVASGLLAFAFSRHISRPLREMCAGAERLADGDLDFHLREPDTLELAVLARALNEMGQRLRQMIERLTQERNELKTVLRSMKESVIALDNDQRILLMNRTATHLFKTNDKEIRNRPISEFVRVSGILKLLDSTTQTRHAQETEVILPAGDQEQILHVIASPMEKKEQEMDGIVLILRDVTRLRRLEQARRDFIANASHELRTPLTSLRGFIETLRDGAIEDPEDARKFLDILSRQSARLQQVIEDLLLLSRLERDAEPGNTVEFNPTPVQAILQTAAQTCRNTANEKQIELAISCPPDLSVSGNAGLLEEALINLIKNALAYSPPESRISLAAERTEDTILIRVQDQGCGIAAHHLPRIFERFYRVDASRDRDSGGTGLGLAIVKHIAALHHGSVTVESKIGTGSTFSLILPKTPQS